MCACYGAVRDETRAVARFETPGDFNALSIANDGVRSWVRRGKNTKIIDRVYWERRLKRAKA
jgi:hypothetical protein